MTFRALAFVEGQTEEKFIKEIIAPVLVAKDIFIVATTPGRKRSQGGAQSWDPIRRELIRYLKEDRDRFVTTMFDYYGMPTNWPGRDAAGRKPFNLKAATIEDAMMDDLAKAMGSAFNRQHFIPYVQMHEFEALLFCDPDALGRVIPDQNITDDLQRIATKFSTPEEINDDPDTAPSKRIIRLAPKYQKVLHGSIAARKIGVDLMRGKCRHFNDWLNRLESPTR